MLSQFRCYIANLSPNRRQEARLERHNRIANLQKQIAELLMELETAYYELSVIEEATCDVR